MRNFDIKYTVKGQDKTEIIRASTSINALLQIIERLGRDKIYFKLINISILGKV